MKNRFKTPIPDGYEIDEDKSTLYHIEYKKKEVNTWNDLVTQLKKRPRGYNIYMDSRIGFHTINNYTFLDYQDKNVYIDEKHAKSALAISQISQLMQFFGGAITNKEWAGNSTKYTIERYMNGILNDITVSCYHLLAFHSEEQRDKFLKNNERLIRDYLMLD